MAKEKISASKLECYLNCPLNCKYKYVDKLPPEVDARGPVVLGIAVHESIHRMYLTRKFNRRFLISNWANIFDKTAIEQKVKFKDEDDKKFWKSQGYPLLNVFYNRAEKEGILKPAIATEKYFKIPYKDFYLTGKIDLIIEFPNGEIVIIDFKTSRKEETARQMMINHQLTFYSWGVRKKLNIKEDRVGLFYIRSGNIKYSTRKRSDYFGLAKKIVGVVEGIRNKKFEPTWNDCKYCDYKKRCKKEYPNGKRS